MDIFHTYMLQKNKDTLKIISHHIAQTCWNVSDNGMMAVILGYHYVPLKNILQSLATLANENSQTTFILKETSFGGK